MGIRVFARYVVVEEEDVRATRHARSSQARLGLNVIVPEQAMHATDVSENGIANTQVYRPVHSAAVFVASVRNLPIIVTAKSWYRYRTEFASVLRHIQSILADALKLSIARVQMGGIRITTASMNFKLLSCLRELLALAIGFAFRDSDLVRLKVVRREHIIEEFVTPIFVISSAAAPFNRNNKPTGSTHNR